MFSGGMLVLPGHALFHSSSNLDVTLPRVRLYASEMSPGEEEAKF